MNLAHQIRLDPTPRQIQYFQRCCGTARFTWNWALAEWKRDYEAGEKPNGRQIRKQFNAIRGEEYPWTYEVHRDCTARPFDNLQVAFQNFFRRVKAGDKRPGYPTFKKKGRSRDSFYLANDQFRIERNKIRIPRLGWIKMREELRFVGKILGATVSRKADQWHVAIQMEVKQVHKDRTGHGAVGIDLGITSSATLSNGDVVKGPKALANGLKKLKRLSRRHSHKEKGSNGRKKATLKLARLHLRIANVRKDWIHKLSTNLVRENQAVGIEDLNVSGMVRNRRLAKSITDEAWRELRRQLEYKGPMFGTEILVHDKWYPSSKTCSGCGNIKTELSLDVRTYECGECGLVIDRDHNAALNLKPIFVPGDTGDTKPVEIAALA